MGTADASRRFAYWSFMVGTLPSRRLAVMSLIGNTSPPLILLVNIFQPVCVLQVKQLRHGHKNQVGRRRGITPWLCGQGRVGC